MPETIAYWLGHPLIAPVIITASWIPIEALLIASLGATPGKWLFGVYLQFAISDAYARRDTRAQLSNGLQRAFRVWWEGVGAGFPLLAPILIAVAYEKLMQNQETDWDFAQDCLVTHGPVGALNAVTGICGLTAMLWLYGVAWHQPMAQSIAWARTTVAEALPSTSALSAGIAVAGGRISGLIASTPRTLSAAGSGPDTKSDTSRPTVAATGPVDPDMMALIAARRAKVEVLKVEGPRMLRAGNFRRAGELCRAWADLDLGNAEAYRCLGQSLQAQGYYQDALAAFRKAKQYDPNDPTLDAAIDRAQRGIVAEFLNKYRR